VRGDIVEPQRLFIDFSQSSWLACISKCWIVLKKLWAKSIHTVAFEGITLVFGRAFHWFFSIELSGLYLKMLNCFVKVRCTVYMYILSNNESGRYSCSVGTVTQVSKGLQGSVGFLQLLTAYVSVHDMMCDRTAWLPPVYLLRNAIQGIVCSSKGMIC
jgi:hypothetical protein